ncbi:vacuolar protein 8-like isoform X2 [Hypomesus transpacificus]|uniref:vacuolar protein 8-like isoform X2 n=1 Tax=Hypomesus transpacificus TaxID=137520 RepID=UPI001F081062|nr:vacuolar protein 8-like isoform X2 [Hypomesus transpacificus]
MKSNARIVRHVFVPAFDNKAGAWCTEVCMRLLTNGFNTTLNMGTGLCEKCEELLNYFFALVKRLYNEFELKIKDCVKALSRCCCLRRSSSPQRFPKRRQRNSAYTSLLQHLNTDNQPPLLNQQCLHALKTLAASEDHDLQGAASMYCLHISQHLETLLPVAFLEPYLPLLLSNDLETQRATSLSLVNLLVKNNVSQEQVVEMGLLVPILETLQSGDPTVQCNSCACAAMLASSESNREAIVSADGVIPLLVLAKSYNSRVQQNAVWALLNLTQSEESMRALCQEGAVPFLALLLQSSDSEIQFNSCSALSNIALVQEHHPKMLGIGDQFLLKSLLMLTSSSVQKNSSQAWKCLKILSGNVEVQKHLLELGVVTSLRALLSSFALPVTEPAITLLSELTTHPPNNENLVDDGLLEVIGHLLVSHGSSSIVIRHSAAVVTNLCTTRHGVQGLMESECLTGLLRVLVSSVATQEDLACVTLCLHHLTSREVLQSRLATKMNPDHVLRLVTLSGEMENQELSYYSASIVSKLQLNGDIVDLLRPHYPAISAYVLAFLKKQEVRFQQLGIVTLCSLKKDGGFVAAAHLEEQLMEVHLQTEQTRTLLQRIQQPPPLSSPESPLPLDRD